tara:strand:+ start:225 stop:701 length:477 start_codon:yes stop_codon:yes gene_type:complete
MIKIKKIILISTFLLIVGCGFEPIYSTKNINSNYEFTINNIGFSGTNSVNKKLKNRLRNFINIEEKPIKYDLIIDSSTSKNITSKNQKGDAEMYFTEIVVKVDVLHNDSLKNKTTFKENFEYENKSNKYELKKYETTIEKNLVSKISEDIIKYLYSIK